MRRQPSVGTQPSQHDLSKQSQLSSLVLPSFSVKNLYKLHYDESEAVFKKKKISTIFLAPCEYMSVSAVYQFEL